MLDSEANPGVVPGRLLYPDSAGSASYQQEHACNQQNSVQGKTKGEQEDCYKENETRRTLAKAWGAASQEIGAVGTNTKAPVKRRSHISVLTYVDILKKEEGGAQSTKWLELA